MQDLHTPTYMSIFAHKLISTPSRDATLYIQQTEENEKQHCELAIRKITVATIVGEGSDTILSLQHHQLGKMCM